MDESRAERRAWVLRAVAEHEASLQRYAARMLHDADAARDAVQHVFLKLCEQSPDVMGDRLVPWLFQVCRNRVLDMIRQRQRTESLPKGNDPPQRGDADPAVSAEQADTRRRLDAAIAELPLAQREVLGLWSEGIRYRQIAELVGLNEGNVRVMVHRALMRLRESPIVRRAMGWDESPATLSSPACEQGAGGEG
jgi:RNA polymerase sigma-70 factor (ECF subfamily)